MFMFCFLDPDYKLKSAAQTPATLHNSRSHDHDLGGGGGGVGGGVGRSLVDDRQTYLAVVSINNMEIEFSVFLLLLFE